MSGGPAESGVRVQDGGGARRVVLARPGKANALSIAMARAAEQAFRAPAGPDIRAFVVSGEGEKGFCAGGDLAELSGGQQAEQYAAMCDLIAAIDERRLPLFTVLHGITLGAACIFPALSDVVLAADNTLIGVPELRFGIYPVLVHSVLLQCLPPFLVHQICIGARSLSASEAFGLGLVTEILPEQDVGSAADARLHYYLERIDAVEAGRQMRRLQEGSGLNDRSRAAEKIVADNLGSPVVRRLLEGWLR